MRPGVLLIRPSQTADPLELAVRNAGYPVYQHAVVAIEPLAVAAAALQEWSSHSWHGIVVISPNAARIFDQQLRAAKLPWPRGNYYAVGSGTAATLVPLCQQPVTYPSTQYTSEGLMSLGELNDLREQRWLLITGENGRDWLPNTLQQRGAEVTPAVIYCRQTLAKNAPVVEPEWRTDVQCIMVSSVEQLQLFMASLSPSEQQWAANCQWVVPTGRVSEQLAQLGVPAAHIHSAANATPAALTHCLQFIKETSFMSEKPTAAPATTATEQGNKQTPSTRKAEPTGRSWFANFMMFIITLCVVVLAAGGYWLWLQQQQIAADTASQLTAVQERLAQAQANQPVFQPQQLQDELTELRASMQQDMERQFARERQLRERGLERAEAMHDDALAALTSATDQNARHISRLQAQARSTDVRQTSHWYLLEAFDLVGAAVHRLRLEYNRDGAIALLAQAQTLLQEQGGNDQQHVIRQLERDMEMLAELPMVNTQAIAMQLARMQGQVRSLTFAAQFRAGVSADLDISNEQRSWRENIANAWSTLSEDLIKVRRNDGVATRLDIDQQTLIMSRMELQLQIAQQAALNHYGDFYQVTLNDLLDTLNTFFTAEQAAVVQMRGELEALLTLPIDPDYPTSLISQAMLRERISELRNNRSGE